MKKLILAGLIAGICGTAVAGDESAIEAKKAENEGVRYNTAVGPYFDPIFDAALVVIPTWSYEIGNAEKTSQTKIYGIYGSNQNWVARFDNNLYWGDDSQWKFDSRIFYTEATLDIGDFMDPNNGSVEITTKGTIGEFFLGYEILNKLYVGPTYYYSKNEYEGDRKYTEVAPGFSIPGTVAMMADKTESTFGLQAVYDNRDNPFTPMDGSYVLVNATRSEVEGEGGAVVPDWVPGQGGFTLNGTQKFNGVTFQLRKYIPIGDNNDTTLALRAAGKWKGDEANETASTMTDLVSGFTGELTGRSTYGLEGQLRHYFGEQDKFGIVGGLSAAKAVEATPVTGDEDVHYSTTLGFRYMLDPKSRSSARLDLHYNDQESDNFIAYFEVNEKF